MAKIRKGFVSNSSSSSFVVIGSNGLEAINWSGEIVDLGSKTGGETEFGWGPDDYHDMYSRINFVYLQTTYVGKEKGKKWLDLIEQAIKEHTNAAGVRWVWTVTRYGDYEENEGYIDHQSCAGEGKNTEMFEDVVAMKAFLFDTGSYIHTDNDNH